MKFKKFLVFGLVTLLTVTTVSNVSAYSTTNKKNKSTISMEYIKWSENLFMHQNVIGTFGSYNCSVVNDNGTITMTWTGTNNSNVNDMYYYPGSDYTKINPLKKLCISANFSSLNPSGTQLLVFYSDENYNDLGIESYSAGGANPYFIIKPKTNAKYIRLRLEPTSSMNNKVTYSHIKIQQALN